MEWFKAFNIYQFGTLSIVLFAVIDIIGSIPLIIELKRKTGEIHPMRATMVSFGIMLVFLFLGESILTLIGISVEAFAVAGALVLFAMALEMVLGVTLFKVEEEVGGKAASVVPLAFPVIAGSGSMTSLLSLRAEYATVNIIAAILVNMVVVYIVLRLTGKMEKWLGKVGIAILRKVFGIILLAMAVKLFSANLPELMSATPK